jgi:methyltransferase FkbM-like protein
MNNFANVECVEAAVSDSPGTRVFLLGHHEGAGHLSTAEEGESGERIVVRVVTLDEFVLQQRHRPPDFIKIDVEGAEGGTLAGGMAVLKNFSPILLVDLHSPEQDAAVGRILAECNYRAYRTGKDGLAQEVRDLRKPWPHPEGIWGQIIALPGRLTK